MSIIKNLMARFNAKKFNIWTEKADAERKPDTILTGDWIDKDGVLYYGHPFFIFFKSCQNDWWIPEGNWNGRSIF